MDFVVVVVVVTLVHLDLMVVVALVETHQLAVQELLTQAVVAVEQDKTVLTKMEALVVQA
jgi:hypothetical protein